MYLFILLMWWRLGDEASPELSSSLRILSLTSSSHCCRICSASSREQVSRRTLSIHKSLSPGSRVPVLNKGKTKFITRPPKLEWDNCKLSYDYYGYITTEMSSIVFILEQRNIRTVFLERVSTSTAFHLTISLKSKCLYFFETSCNILSA